MSNLQEHQTQVPEAPFLDFNSWFEEILSVTNPDLVIAAARGAVRLLQMQNIGPDTLQVPMFSHSALPFLDDEMFAGKRVLLFDDSVIFGSVMRELYDYTSHRGAVPLCAAYATDRCNFLGRPDSAGQQYKRSPHAHLPVRYRHQLEPGEVAQHHATLVNTVLATPHGYNLDFPTFRLALPSFGPADIPYLLSTIARANGVRRVETVMCLGGHPGGIHRYTLFLREPAPEFFSNKSIWLRPFTKARLVFSPFSAELRITPLCQLAIVDGTKFSDVRFSDQKLQDCWAKLHPPRASDKFFSEGLFRLATAVVSLRLGTTLSSDIRQQLQPHLAVGHPELLQEDLSLVLGDANRRALGAVCEGFAPVTWKAASVSPSLQPSLHTEKLLTEIANLWQQQRHLQPQSYESPVEMVGKILFSIQKVTDSEKARDLNPNSDRLKVGVSYEAVKSLLRDHCKIELDDDRLSVAIDSCVDCGLAVPKVIQDGSIWIRAFYCGENENDQPVAHFKESFRLAYKDYLATPKSKPFNRFDAHKFCACMKDLMGWLPLNQGFQQFGRYATIGKEELELVQGLTGDGNDDDDSEGFSSVGPLTMKRIDGRLVLLPNDDYRSAIELKWSKPERGRDFANAFHHTAMAFARCSYDAKLLLSTCRTHRHTFNAIAYEVYTWASRETFPRGFGLLLAILKANLSSGRVLEQDAVVALYWCIRYVSEGFKKHRIFHQDFQELREELRGSYLKQGPAGRTWWEYLEARHLFKPELDDEITERFRFLLPLLSQAERLTVYLTKILAETGVLPISELDTNFDRHGTSLRHEEFKWLFGASYLSAAQRYNNVIGDPSVAGSSFFRSKLPLSAKTKSTPQRQWALDAVEAASACFAELEMAIREYVKRYKVEEDDFPFSPLGLRRSLDDRSTEEVFTGYVMALDIIGSTNTAQSPDMKERIRCILQRFESLGVRAEETRNDQFVAVSDDISVLMDMANSIRLEGSTLAARGGRFKGTRKAIATGTVNIATKPDGGYLIGDAQTPNIIPAVCYMATAIDEGLSIDQQNSFVVFSDGAARQAQGKLGLAIEKLKKVSIASKHFNGDVYLVALPDPPAIVTRVDRKAKRRGKQKNQDLGNTLFDA